MKVKELQNVRENLLQLSQYEIKLRSSYNIAKFLYQTESDNSFFEQNISKMISDYAARDQNNNIIYDGNVIKVEENNLEKCQERLSQIYEYDVEAPELVIFYDDLPENIPSKILFNLIQYIKK